MKDKQRAIISWTRPEEGGRKSVPGGPVYSTVARFEEDGKWPHEAWSLALDFERRFSNPRIALASVRFLASDTAPNHLLHGGSRFELFEGSKRVAKGIILPPTTEVPAELNDFESALIG